MMSDSVFDGRIGSMVRRARRRPTGASRAEMLSRKDSLRRRSRERRQAGSEEEEKRATAPKPPRGRVAGTQVPGDMARSSASSAAAARRLSSGARRVASCACRPAAMPSPAARRASGGQDDAETQKARPSRASFKCCRRLCRSALYVHTGGPPPAALAAATLCSLASHGGCHRGDGPREHTR